MEYQSKANYYTQSLFSDTSIRHQIVKMYDKGNIKNNTNNSLQHLIIFIWLYVQPIRSLHFAKYSRNYNKGVLKWLFSFIIIKIVFMISSLSAI